MATDKNSEHFVGRGAELEMLGRALEAARDRRPRVVLITGEAGIGKSALLRRFLQTTGDCTVLFAVGEEIEGRLPFGVLEQLLRDSPTLERLAVFEDAGTPGTDPLVAGADMLELIGALQDRGGPVVIAIDDVHLSDGPSLHALSFLARRLRADRVLVLFSARAEAMAEMPVDLERLTTRVGGEVIRLHGLNADDVRGLADAVVPGGLAPSVVRRLLDHTHGNALWLQALIHELPPEVLRRDDVPLPAPRSFANLVLGRLAGCERETEALVVAAAVIGTDAPLSLVARAAGLDAQLPALDEAVRARLLRVGDTPTERKVAFTHPLVRSAVYHDLSPARRADVHRRVAELMDGTASLRHRVEATAGTDPHLAVEIVAAARADAHHGAWASAAAWYQAAARMVPDRSRHETLVLEAIACLEIGGDLRGALALAESTTGFEDSPLRRYVLGRLALVTGRPEEAAALLRGAWESAGPQEPTVAAQAAAQLALLMVNAAEGPAIVQWAERALAADAPGVAAANPIMALGMGLAIQGRHQDGLKAATARLDRFGAPRLARLDARLSRGVLRMWTDDLAGAAADLAAVAAECLHEGPFQTAIVAEFYRGENAYRAGDWDAAVTEGELAVSMARGADQPWMGRLALAVASFPLSGRGEWESAEAYARQATRAAGQAGDLAARLWAAMAVARLAQARGDQPAMVEALAPIAQRPRPPALEEPGIQPWQGLWAEALVSVGRLEEAALEIDELSARAEERRLPPAQAQAATARGRLEAARGQPEAAEEAYRAGLEAAPSGARLETARLEAAYGAFLRRVGRRRDASERLSSALARLEHLGARPYQTVIERELAACGRSRPRRGDGPPAELTPQEFAVAHLVAQGLSNRDVAARLVVSVKTVEYHLGNIFSKLGVRSRTQLAARFARED